ncbi:MAG: RecQ family ATP-dependent DNA helicase [Pirellulaceae bacterium]
MTNYNDQYDQALQRFGLTSFRPGQREVIEAIVAGQDCMCVMPTGGGKSLCFQLPSLIRPGLTIVVSPLIALMKDQVDSLGRHGIPAALINSTLSQGEQQQRLEDVAAGKYQLVYVAPERLRNNRFMEAIRATPIQLLAIDEAHCISQWGHDFRPDYTRIGRFREWLGGVQTVALTATATPRVRDDIVEVLGLKRPKQFMSGFARPNLHFGVVQKPSDREKDEEVEKFLRRITGSGIIYAATRKRCDALVELISSKLKMPVGAYHAGLMADQRRAIQERFMRGELQIIVATNAFGMGIDKSDLRFVIHYNMPGSLEAYYQEAGRAGRDGEQSQCVMLYSFQDRYIQEFFIDNNYPPREVIRSVYEFLMERKEDPIELTLEEIRDALGLSISPEAVGSALQVLGRTGVLERFEMGGGLAIVTIDSDLPTLVDLLPREATVRRKVMRLIERAVGDRRHEQVHLHPRWLLSESGMERDALSRTLRELSKLDEFDYVPPFRGRAVHFLRRDVAFDDLDIDFENLTKRKEAEYDRLNRVVNYAQSPLCRQATILNYFGDTSAENCGQCDRCGRSPGWPKFDVAPLPETKRKSLASTSQTLNRTGADDAASTSAPAKSTAPAAKRSLLTPEQQLQFLTEVIRAIERIHGRLGKLLISQYLCGSQSAKLLKLNLHRLGSFGMLKNFRQADGVKLLDILLSVGALRQQEVNRNRPTVSVAPELLDVAMRDKLLSSIELPPKLQAQILPLVSKSSASANAAARLTNSQTPPTSTKPTSQPSTSQLGTAATSKATQPVTLHPPHLNASVEAKPPIPQSLFDHPIESAAPTQTKDTATADWQWTLKLFQARHAWHEVCLIRRMSDEELATSLSLAIRAGGRIERSWLSPVGDGLRTSGQQRILRELQRRSSAGV